MNDPIHLRLLRRVGSVLSERATTACLNRALRVAGVADAPKISTFTSKAELRALYDLARGCPKGATALEIGSYLGASTCYLAAGLREVGGTLYCVDTWQNQTMPDGERDTMAEFTRNTAGVRNLLRLIRKPSSELTDSDIPTQFDLIFIDGDHSYEATKFDFNRVVPWLAEKGFVAMHDHASFQGVARMVGEILGTGSWIIAGQKENLIWLTRQKKWW